MNSRSGESEDAWQTRVGSTRWSLIDLALSGDPQESQAALEQLIEQYSQPLLDLLRYGPWQLDEATSLDYLQGFLEQKVLSGQLLRSADPEKGRFRNLLYVSFRNFARDRYRADVRRETHHRARAQQRDVDPDAGMESFDKSWARELVQRVITMMRLECERTRQMHVWHVFEGRLLRPVTNHQPPVPYSELVGRLGFRSNKEAADCLTTAKRMLRRLMEQVIAEYTRHPEEADEEIRTIQKLFAQGLNLTPLKDAAANIDETDDDRDSDHELPAVECSWLFARALDLPRLASQDRQAALQEAANALLNRPLQELLFLTGDVALADSSLIDNITVGQFLSGTERPLPVLRQLKAWTKHEYSTGEESIPTHVVSALYFSIVAAGHLDHQVWLTSLRREAVASSCTQLALEHWLPVELIQLIRSLNSLSN